MPVDDATERAYQERLWQAKALMPHLAGDHVFLDQMIEASRERQTSRAQRHVMKKRRVWDEQDRHRDGSGRKRPLYAMFLDESGRHELVAKVDPGYPVFALCGVIIRDGYPLRKIARAIGTLKDTYLGDDSIPLHWFNITSKNGQFSVLEDPARHNAFHAQLDAIRQESDYVIIAAVIEKGPFLQKYSAEPVDAFLPHSPYAICLHFVVERFLHFLWYHEQSKGRIIAEARGERENSELQLEFLRLGLFGTQYVSEKWVRYHLHPIIKFRRKEECVAGLELADIVVGPIAKKCLEREVSPLGWASLKGRFYDGLQGRPESYGLKIFPDPATSDMFD